MRQLSAGKGKGKSKDSFFVPQDESSQESQSSRTSRSSSTSRIAIQLKYFDAKITFILKDVEPTLVKLLKKVFAQRVQLQNYSVLNLLKLPNRVYDEKSFTHQIDTKQALTLLFHLQAIKNGEVNEVNQLRQLLGILQQLELDRNQIDPDFRQEYDQRRQIFNNEVQYLRKDLKEFYSYKVREIRTQFPQTQDFLRIKFLQAKIEQLSLKLIDETTIGIRQFGPKKQRQAQLIYEHPYPSQVYKKDALIQKIGAKLYFKKKVDFLKVCEYARIHGIKNTNLIVCHICKNLVEGNYIRCSQEDLYDFQPTYLTSPNTYYRRMIAVDYRYKSHIGAIMEQELDYFKYYETSDETTQCNRIYCAGCFPKLRIYGTKKSIEDHKCDFCCQVCTCQSCLTAYDLVRALAHFKSILINNFQLLFHYKALIKQANGCVGIIGNYPKSKSTEYCRTGFEQDEDEDFRLSYEAQMDRYKALIEKVKFAQELGVPQNQCMTSQIVEIRKMLQQFKKQKIQEQKIQEPKEGKSLEKVYRYFQQLQRQRKQLQDSEQDSKQGLEQEEQEESVQELEQESVQELESIQEIEQESVQEAEQESAQELQYESESWTDQEQDQDQDQHQDQELELWNDQDQGQENGQEQAYGQEQEASQQTTLGEDQTIFNKFCVLKSQIKKIPTQVLSKQEQVNIKTQLLQMFPTLSPQKESKLIHLKAEVPLDEQDYEDFQVPAKSKIYSQREHIIQYLIKQGIFRQFPQQDKLEKDQSPQAIQSIFKKKQNKFKQISFTIKNRNEDQDWQDYQESQKEERRKKSERSRTFEKIEALERERQIKPKKQTKDKDRMQEIWVDVDEQEYDSRRDFKGQRWQFFPDNH